MLSKLVTIKNEYDYGHYVHINLDNLCFAEYDPDAQVSWSETLGLRGYGLGNSGKILTGKLELCFNGGVSNQVLTYTLYGKYAEALHEYMINAGQWIGVP